MLREIATLLCAIAIFLGLVATQTFPTETIDRAAPQRPQIFNRPSSTNNVPQKTDLKNVFQAPTALTHCPVTRINGEYMLKPALSTIAPFPVFCEFGGYAGDGGSIVIHRRFNGTLSFDRAWADYRDGFGSLQGEFWLGLEKMHQITRGGHFELTVVLMDDLGFERSAKYSRFLIKSEFDRYVLSFGSYLNGNAGDSLKLHNNNQFETIDRTSGNKTCARDFKSGWWYKKCHDGNLNVPYDNGKILSRVIWSAMQNVTTYIREARMLIRPTE